MCRGAILFRKKILRTTVLTLPNGIAPYSEVNSPKRLVSGSTIHSSLSIELGVLLLFNVWNKYSITPNCGLSKFHVIEDDARGHGDVKRLDRSHWNRHFRVKQAANIR